MFGTPDRYEEKNIVLAIQFMCKLRGTVQATDPEPPEPELGTPNKDHAVYRQEEQWWVGHKPQ